MSKTYIHYKNGKRYKIAEKFKNEKLNLQENGEWVEAIAYTEEDKTDLYFRSKREFEEKFAEQFEIQCAGNNDNGCFLDSCGHNCHCIGIDENFRERRRIKNGGSYEITDY